jgi:hypothetical protein
MHPAIISWISVRSNKAGITITTVVPTNRSNRSQYFALQLLSKAKTMTFSSKSPSPPAVCHIGFEQIHDNRPRHHFYSTPPQLTLVDVLAMQAQAQVQAQAPSSSGGGFATMPIWTGEMLRLLKREWPWL